MRTISPNLKARVLAITVGLTYLAAVLLAMGVTQKAAASELDPRPELERVIDVYFDEEHQRINTRLACRLSGTDCGQTAVVSVNRETLLAQHQKTDWIDVPDSETLVGQANSELRVVK